MSEDVHEQIARIYSGRTQEWWEDPAHWRDRDACREDTEAIAEWVAAALAEERDRARAPFLAYADRCAAIDNDRKAGVIKRALNRSVAQAIHRAAEESAQ